MVVISSPSGGGKTTVVRHLLSGGDSRFTRSISMTTRQPRFGEVEGQDYFFVDTDTFRQKIDQGEFIEYENIHGFYYGTPRKALEKRIDQNLIVLLAIDVHGAFSIRRIFPDSSFLVFLQPPDLECLRKRLAGRRTETSAEIQERLERAAEEISLGQQFEYVIVNDRLQDTVNKIREKILDKRRAH